jgi:hypothetical protein
MNTGLHQLIITFLVFKNSTNQKEDRKILFSDWLFRFLRENLMKTLEIKTFLKKQGKFSDP